MLAALGPKMLALAASRTRGTHTYLVTPEHTAQVRAELGAGPLIAAEQGAVLETDPDRARDDRPPEPGRLPDAAQLHQQLPAARLHRGRHRRRRLRPADRRAHRLGRRGNHRRAGEGASRRRRRARVRPGAQPDRRRPAAGAAARSSSGGGWHRRCSRAAPDGGRARPAYPGARRSGRDHPARERSDAGAGRGRPDGAGDTGGSRRGGRARSAPAHQPGRPDRSRRRARGSARTRRAWSAEQLGISPHTVYAELGVLQQTLFTRACRRDRPRRGVGRAHLRRRGARPDGFGRRAAAITVEPEPEAKTPADTVLSPAQQVISKLEIDRQLYVAARQYAIIETALRAAAGQSIDEHAREVAALWDGFAAIAATRPEAWKRDVTPLGDGKATAQEPLVLLALHQAARLVLDRRPGRGLHPVLGRGGRELPESPVNIGFFRMRRSSPTR